MGMRKIKKGTLNAVTAPCCPSGISCCIIFYFLISIVIYVTNLLASKGNYNLQRPLQLKPEVLLQQSRVGLWVEEVNSKPIVNWINVTIWTFSWIFTL